MALLEDFERNVDVTAQSADADTVYFNDDPVIPMLSMVFKGAAESSLKSTGLDIRKAAGSLVKEGYGSRLPLSRAKADFAELELKSLVHYQIRIGGSTPMTTIVGTSVDVFGSKPSWWKLEQCNPLKEWVVRSFPNAKVMLGSSGRKIPVR